MQHSPSVQCSETGQQCHHTLVLAVAAASCELLSESRTSGNVALQRSILWGNRSTTVQSTDMKNAIDSYIKPL